MPPAQAEAVVHAPYESMDCTACHDPHRSSVRSLLRSPDERTLCWTCHQPIKAALATKFPHGPAGIGECSACHRPHTSPEPKLLRLPSTEMCGKCHTDTAREIDTLACVHGPVTTDCTLCHDPHGSDQPHTLKAEQRKLCLGCHKEMGEKMGAATLVHGALNTAKQCLNCHQPHATKFPKLLAASVKDGCVLCHNEPIARPEGKPVAAVGADIATKKFLHGPIREGDCSGCHQPHAALVQNLLQKPYPPRFYAPYEDGDYELCFGCHDSKVFETEQTTSLTSFRDGARNLHFLHVSKKEKGRTCRACHEVHASNLPKHMAEKVPFGDWMMPINYVPSPTGGSCAPGCHKRQSYDYGAALAPKKQ